FIGDSNIVDGIMHGDFIIEFSGIVFECVDKGFENNEQVEIVIRPEDIEIASVEDGQMKGMVKSVTFKGVHYEMLVDDGEAEWKIHSTIKKAVGTGIGMRILPENIHVMKKVN